MIYMYEKKAKQRSKVNIYMSKYSFFLQDKKKDNLIIQNLGGEVI